MAVSIGNGSRVLLSVRGAGLKGDPGEIPAGYLKSIALVSEDSDRVVIRRDDNSAFYLGNVFAEDMGDGQVKLTITNRNGAVMEVAVAGGDEIVILNNPVVYLRAGGQANPPIKEQSDLTEANAFNSMQAIRNFMRKTLTQGTLTIDGRGTYEAAGDIGSTIMKASNVLIRGDSTNPDLLTFASSGNSSGIVNDGGTATIRDLTLRIADGDTVSGRVGGLRANAPVSFKGTIRFTGNYDQTKANRVAGAHLAFSSGDGDLDMTTARLVFEMNGGHHIRYAFASFDGSRFRIGSGMEYVFNSNVKCDAFNVIGQSGYANAFTVPNPVPVFSGSGIINADYLWQIDNLASLVFSGWNPLTHSEWPMTPIANNIKPFCVVGGVMGQDL